MLDQLIDPVCGAKITYDTAKARSQYKGQTYYFHSLDCKEAFDKNPEKYIQKEQAASQ